MHSLSDIHIDRIIRERNGNLVECEQLSLGFVEKFVGVSIDMINYAYLAWFYTLRVSLNLAKKTW